MEPIESNLKSKEGKQILQDFKIKYDTDQVSQRYHCIHNEIMNFLHRDELEEDGQIWSYRKFLCHSQPLTKKDKEYKRISYNVLVEE